MNIYSIIVLFILFPIFPLAQDRFEDVGHSDSIIHIPQKFTHSTKDIAAFVQNNLSNDEDKIKAIFTWVANTFEYDIEKMNSIQSFVPKRDKISDIMKSHKGICENYAAVFSDICNKAGLTSYVIQGFTEQNGVMDTLPHAWNAAKIDTTWYLFDPTWASGYISNKKFIKQLNTRFYKVAPTVMIETHMPFDPIWQFIPFPLRYEDFEGRDRHNSFQPPYLDFLDAIDIWLKQNREDQLISMIKRIEKNGVANTLVLEELKHLQSELLQVRQKVLVQDYNTAVLQFNESVKEFNRYIYFKNRQFKPEKPDAVIQKMLNPCSSKLQKARDQLEQIIPGSAELQQSIISLRKKMDTLLSNISKEQIFIEEYLKSNNHNRKLLFIKNSGTRKSAQKSSP